ncbi:ABC transporter, partial [Rhizobium ruizarguesonis]
AEIPSIFANWNNLPVRNIAYRERRDPIANPIYRFGIAPGATVKPAAWRARRTSVPWACPGLKAMRLPRKSASVLPVAPGAMPKR